MYGLLKQMSATEWTFKGRNDKFIQKIFLFDVDIHVSSFYEAKGCGGLCKEAASFVAL